MLKGCFYFMKITETFKNLLIKNPIHILITTNKQFTRILVQENNDINLIHEMETLNFNEVKNEVLTMLNLQGNKEQEIGSITLNDVNARITAINKPNQVVCAISF